MPSTARTVKMKGSNFFVDYNEYGKLKPYEKYIHVDDDLLKFQQLPKWNS